MRPKERSSVSATEASCSRLSLHPRLRYGSSKWTSSPSRRTRRPSSASFRKAGLSRVSPGCRCGMGTAGPSGRATRCGWGRTASLTCFWRSRSPISPPRSCRFTSRQAASWSPGPRSASPTTTGSMRNAGSGRFMAPNRRRPAASTAAPARICCPSTAWLSAGTPRGRSAPAVRWSVRRPRRAPAATARRPQPAWSLTKSPANTS